MEYIVPYILPLLILYLATRVLFKAGLPRNLFRQIMMWIVVISVISFIVQLLRNSDLLLVLLLWMIFSFPAYLYLRSEHGDSTRRPTSGGERVPIMPPVDENEEE